MRGLGEQGEAMGKKRQSIDKRNNHVERARERAREAGRTRGDDGTEETARWTKRYVQSDRPRDRDTERRERHAHRQNVLESTSERRSGIAAIKVDG